MLERLMNLTIIEYLAFALTVAVMISLTLLLPYKIIKEINNKETK